MDEMLEDEILPANDSRCPGVDRHSEEKDRQVHLARQSNRFHQFIIVFIIIMMNYYRLCHDYDDLSSSSSKA